ncbi:hypothetical protein QKU48_gp0354 [Fadolivirus algeromassiliense]|jgi:hypothetical protein|uniref:Uncharacterized protein n=1 Tax=Fadolivirus FV1/VV64 TaxID=3070911 RepID=A0A7D3V5G6_9VIRU|nr:hypothetical protein QKU48_gp0354 [Fadolivirus algeromassiliense]QKF93812.1 hypothetical protein Fadolivirus_1_354 [Fadolivirus FV1/VV64]
MDSCKIEVIPISKIGEFVLKNNNQFQFDSIFQNSNITTTLKYKIYIYKDLWLVVDDNMKMSYRIKFLNSKLLNKSVYIKQKYESIPLENFPFLDRYDRIINRTIIQYNNGYCKVTDVDVNTNEILTFVGVDNDDKLNNLIKIIEGTS